MGQYYRALLIDDDGGIEIASAREYDNGVKLMEHSWVGNTFVNAVFSRIEDRPCRIVWMGDYADDAENANGDEIYFSDGFVTTREEFVRYFDAVWNRDGTKRMPKNKNKFLFDDDHPDIFIVNLTKKCYIDMDRYISDNHPASFDTVNWYVNPLPLLTSIGNGLGGGDYYGEADNDMVGIWAFDKIYVSALKPENMQEVCFFFHE